MAKMIPLHPVPTRSGGELEVFARLKDDPITRDWIVLHSLNIATHRKQVSGEADFVVIIPHKGVLLVEVKACTYLKREGGLWFLGNLPPETRGPFKQAAEAMHSLRQKLLEARPDLSRVPFSSCVIFTNLRFRENSVEWNPWQVIDSSLIRAIPLGRSLDRVMDEARAHIRTMKNGAWLQHTSKEPYHEQCKEIADFFRPDFECFPDYKTLVIRAEADLKRFTDEQLIALDSMEMNPRVVFKGPAGTGKTILAIEAAKRASGRKDKVLLVCFNKLLGMKLAKECETTAPLLRAKTLHSHMMDVAGLKHAPSSSDSNFWESELPTRAIDALLDTTDSPYLFDQLVVDEAQDILKPMYLDFLDLTVRGGLGAGVWKMFGDFENQAIYGAANLTLEHFYKRLSAPPTEYSLRVNCRNTPSIATLAQLIGGLSPGYRRVLRPHDGIEPQYMFYENEAEQVGQLEAALSNLFELGLSNDEIVILSTRGDDRAAACYVKTPRWATRIRKYDRAQAGYIRYCSIGAFKGLEASAIIVTDLDDLNKRSFESLTYIAVTRSLHRLILLIHKAVGRVMLTSEAMER